LQQSYPVEISCYKSGKIEAEMYFKNRHEPNDIVDLQVEYKTDG